MGKPLNGALVAAVHRFDAARAHEAIEQHHELIDIYCTAVAGLTAEIQHVVLATYIDAIMDLVNDGECGVPRDDADLLSMAIDRCSDTLDALKASAIREALDDLIATIADAELN